MQQKQNKPEEYLEEWDWKTAEPTGKAVSRKKAHKEGIAHEGVHLWVIRTEPETEVLFQRRAKDKDTFPGCLDITVGGHVPFGVNENKIQKEAYEEIGISPADSDLTDLGYYRYEEKIDDFDHREFQHVFLLTDNRALNEYNFVDNEVEGIYAVKLPDLISILHNDYFFSVEGYEGSELISMKVSRKDFHPLLFTGPMEQYMKIIIEAVTGISLGREVTAKMPSVKAAYEQI
ncbi:MAG: NUDIX domain-containing protein [Spirochaetes bacterium]|nr:NUDIX domain-containing protein [Spirochaetota bacterium]